MCGIAGHLNLLGNSDPRAVAAMTAGLAHRGPDDGDVWSSQDNSCAFGHRRLSIIDLSPLGRQPMLDPETGNCIVFNGEVYNFQELRKECEANGARFRSQSDTEVILALYRQRGTDCLQSLRGMFAFALWDAEKRRLFLARDRVGKKPLNYAVLPQGLAFASELRPLSRFPGVDRTLDLEALELYLQLQSVPAPWTVYKGIRKLPPAHFALFDSSGLRIERYWNVDYREKLELSDADALDALEEHLLEAVRLRMISDVPIGALLSGGVDSSVVVSLMSRLATSPVRTFNIGFEEDAYNEAPYAKQAADICKTVHVPKVIAGDVATLLPVIAQHYGEPFADSSAIPSFHVCRAAREDVTVVLNGDGGDELLAGYPRYCLSDAQQLAAQPFRHALGGARLAHLSQSLLGSSWGARIRRRFLFGAAFPETASLNMYSAFWNDADRGELLADTAGSDVLGAWRTAWAEGAIASATGPIDRMLWIDSRTYLSDDLMVKMDIASMHCGLEARSPLLDHKVIEFCASLPERMKVRGGVGKWLLKRLASRTFPYEFVHRKKMGFGIPLAEWLRGPLKAHVEERLRDHALMEPLDARRIELEWTRFVSGESQHASRIWALLMFAEWRAADLAP
jgi:asparagine synthase (glutamine-hydrolysing)